MEAKKISFGISVLFDRVGWTYVFTFSQNGAQLLLETDLKYVVWCGQAITLFLLHQICDNGS